MLLMGMEIGTPVLQGNWTSISQYVHAFYSDNSLPENYSKTVGMDDCKNVATHVFIPALFKIASNENQSKHQAVEVSSINYKCD